MQTLKLKKNLVETDYYNESVYTDRDFVNIPNSLIPGEWIIVEDPDGKRLFAIINTRTDKGTRCYPIKEFNKEIISKTDENAIAKEVIQQLISSAIERRKIIYNDNENYRLIFGFNDCLPGVVADKYSDIILLQITTAGFDRFRSYIKELIETMLHIKVVIYDKSTLRKDEYLPSYPSYDVVDEISIVDNCIKYNLPMKMLQKNGYYFDHVENRIKFENFLKRYQGSKETGLDLFCYSGSWGIHALRAGVKKISFVDQGDFGDIIKTAIEKNSIPGDYEFIRDDVFSCLESLHKLNKTYDLIISDPPAFSKNVKNVRNAIKGYKKLYKKVFPLMNHKSLLVVASCTHGVQIEDLSKIIKESAIYYNKRITLMELGTQGADHPVTGVTSKGYYLKYLLYLVENI